MKSTSELVEKISNNAIQSIGIDNQIAYGFDKIGRLTDNRPLFHKMHYVGDNKLITFEGLSQGYVNVATFDLATKKVTPNQTIKLPIKEPLYWKDSVVLSDKNYIAIDDMTGKVSILNLKEMKIDKSHPDQGRIVHVYDGMRGIDNNRMSLKDVVRVNHDGSATISGGYYPGLIPGRTIYFYNERINGIDVISDEEKLILLRMFSNRYPGQDPSILPSYLYDLKSHTILGKIDFNYYNPRLAYPGIQQTSSSTFAFSGSEDIHVASLHQIKEVNELNSIFSALKLNTSVTQVKISGIELDDKNIQNLYDLKQTRPQLDLQLSDLIQLQLKTKELHELDKKLNAEKIQVLTLKLSKMEAEMRTRDEEIRMMKQSMQDSFKEVGEKMALMQNDILKLQKDAKESSAVIAQLREQRVMDEEKLNALHDNMSGSLTEVLELIEKRTPPEPLKPLPDALADAKDLNDGLIKRLMQKNQNLHELNLIRWENHPDLKEIQADLLKRGAILSVKDLYQRIIKVKPMDKQDKVTRLQQAIEQLLSDFEGDLLPDSAIKALRKCVKSDISTQISDGKNQNLKNQYLTEVDTLKNELVSTYFISNNMKEAAELDQYFHQLIEKISKDKSYERYKPDLVKEKELLSKIRTGFDPRDKSFNNLAKKIKNSFDIDKIAVSKEMHEQAVESILDKPTEDILELIDAAIINFWINQKFNLSQYATLLASQGIFKQTHSVILPINSNESEKTQTLTQNAG